MISEKFRIVVRWCRLASADFLTPEVVAVTEAQLELSKAIEKTRRWLIAALSIPSTLTALGRSKPCAALTDYGAGAVRTSYCAPEMFSRSGFTVSAGLMLRANAVTPHRMLPI